MKLLSRNETSTAYQTVIPVYAGMTDPGPVILASRQYPQGGDSQARQTVILALRQYPQGVARARRPVITDLIRPFIGTRTMKNEVLPR